MNDHITEFIYNTLVSYIEHVGECEGVNFLSDKYSDYFPPGKWEVLRAASRGITYHEYLTERMNAASTL